jgi:hypothetical protein
MKLILIEDAHDPESNLGSTIDPFRRPRRVDEIQQQSAAEPPIGEGTYLHTCVECGFPFKSDDREACLCDPCNKADAAQMSHGWEWYASPYRRFRRGE